ncbi:hypothetical protein ONZ45_g7957 [Pleurotus djamor]|nr:hypothetical protein ONZ45_g7957 [Pleurotus djamor]
MRLFVLPNGSTRGQTLGAAPETTAGLRRREIPLEILVEILSMAHDHVKAKSGQQLCIPEAQDLQRLSLVCKGWYNAVSSTPSFWRTFAKGADPNVLAAHLSHTANTTMKFIRFDLTCQPLPPASLNLILSQLRRLEALRLAVPASDLPLLFSNLSHDAPNMTDLMLFLLDGRGAKPFSLPDSLFNGRCPPLLTQLRLSGFRISWTSPLLSSSLTHLYLGSQSPFESCEEFCEVVGRLRNVQDLTLHECLPFPTSASTSKVQLPHLSRLSLHGDVDSLTGTLKCLSAQLLYLEITSDVTRDKIPPVIDECIRLLDPHLPSSPGPSVNYCSGLTLDLIDITDPTFCLEVCIDVAARDGTVQYGPTFEAALYFNDESDPFLDIDAALETCLDKLPLLDVTTFHSAHRPEDPAHYWFDVIGPSLRSLQTIVITERSAYLDFLKVYKHYLDSLLSLRGLDPETLQDKPIFSGLVSIQYKETELEETGIDETQEEYDSLYSIRRRRSSLGLPDIAFSIVKMKKDLPAE